MLKAANRGDNTAYNRLLVEMAPVLRKLIAARGGLQMGEVEDILQETLIAIHEKRHTWREGEPVTSWVYAIARYKTVDAWRRTMRRPTVPFDEEDDETAAMHNTDPTHRHDLARLLARVDDRSADIIRTVKIEGYSADEAGARLGMSPASVRVALHRALRRLDALLNDTGPAKTKRGKD